MMFTKGRYSKMTCEKCGFEGFEDDSFCRQCGEEYDCFNCECGVEIDEGDNYCHSCGAALEGVVEDSDESSNENLAPEGMVQPEIVEPVQENQNQNW